MLEAAEEATAVPVINVRVTLPECVTAADKVEIPFTGDQLVGDLRQYLAALPVARNLTHYRVVIGGAEVTDDTVFGDIGGDGVDVAIKEKPYTLLAVYDQITKFRQTVGLHYLDRVLNDLSVQLGASKINTLGLKPVGGPTEEEEAKKAVEEELDKKEDQPAKKLLETEQELLQLVTAIPEPLSLQQQAAYATTVDQLKCPIRSIMVLQWLPVPAQQRLKGDLLYLTIQTLEEETFNITCHVLGFFVNQCLNHTFNPLLKVNEKGKFHKEYLLYNLVAKLLAQFEPALEAFDATLTLLTDLPETYFLPTAGFTACPWVAEAHAQAIKPDISRLQLPLIANGVDGADYVKDWNEEVQAVKELPTLLIEERVLREHLLLKTLHEFSVAATHELVNIIHENVPAMNPDDEARRQIYLRNGIFYSNGGVDVDNYPETGGDAAAWYLSGKDLSTVQVLNKLMTLVLGQDVHTVATCAVDYMGHRVIAQAPVPGIFSQPPEDVEAEERVVYGLSLDKLVVEADPSFEEPLKRVAEMLHLKPHTVGDKKLVVSQDFKGINGTDQRKYLIDTFRATPRDIEFIEAHWDPKNPESLYPHAEPLLRLEAVDLWWRQNVSELLKGVKEGEPTPDLANKFLLNPDAFAPGVKTSPEDEADVRAVSKFVKETLIGEWVKAIPQMVAPFDGANLTRQLHDRGINMRYLGFIADEIQAALAAHHSVEAEQIKVNVARAEEVQKEQEAKLEAEKKRRADLAEARAQALKEGKEPPVEEKEEEEEKPEDHKIEDTKATFHGAVANYTTVYRLAVQEMVSRAAKHVLRSLGADVPKPLYAAFVAHFHNCLLLEVTGTVELDATTKALFPEQQAFFELDAAKVSQLIKQVVLQRFRFQLPDDWRQQVPAQVLLREIAIKFGIQWKAQDYAFTQQAFDAAKQALASPEPEAAAASAKNGKKDKKKGKKQSAKVEQVAETRTLTFVALDILAFVPVIKDSQYKAQLVDELYASARAHIANEDKEIGSQILGDLVTIEEQMYSRVHKETAQFYLNMSQLFGEVDATSIRAAAMARKAIAVAERTFGPDSFDLVRAYINAAYLEAQTGGADGIANALKMYRHAVSVIADIYGTADHPAVISTLTLFADSLVHQRYLTAAAEVMALCLELLIRVHGDVSEMTGFIYYRLANIVVNISTDEYAAAQKYFAHAGDIFVKLLGPDDPLLKEAMTTATNLAAYLKFTEMQAEAKKHSQAHEAKAKAKVKPAAEPQVKKGKGKKHTQTAPDPAIASQSVDDILKYIEGTSGSKKKLKKKN